MRAATDLLVGESSKPTFNEIDPGCAGRHEVHVETGTLGQPVPDRGGLVSAIVVQDQMDVKRLRNILVNGVQELTELGTPMTAVTFPDHRTGLHVQGGKQGRGAVPF